MTNVAVIIVNWNGAPFLEHCLSALMAQTVAPSEIIVVDNASSDDSVEIIRRFPVVRLIASGQNNGFARGNNIALRAMSVQSEWVVLLNPDAFVEPDWLEALLQAAAAYPTFVAFGSCLLDAANPQYQDGAGDVYHLSGLVWRAGHGAGVQADQVREIFSPCAAAAMYKRGVLFELGGFDEDFFCYVEDVDLGFRLRLAGHRCLYVPQSVAHHVGSGTTGGQHSDFSIYHGHRNLVWTFVKNMPGSLFWLLLPLHLLLNLVSVLWFALRGRGSVILRAKFDAIKGLPRVWHQRQQTQRQRRASVADIWRALSKRGLWKRHELVTLRPERPDLLSTTQK